ncbi:MAG: phosphate starvation-inducible protein PhoH [Myxococcales bacterium]|nr:phosphate starvation-inducible protein PhoH [Myxococcales bacterium]
MARAAHLASDYASQERRESPRRLSTPSSPSGHEPSPRSPEHPHPDASLSPAAPNDATPDDVGTPAIAETSESPVTSAEQTVVASLEVADTQVLQQLCGPRSALLAELARHSGADVSQRGNVIRISGAPEDTRVAQRFLEDAAQLIHQGVDVNLGDVGHSVRTLRRDPERSLVELLDQVIIVTSRSRPVAPKTATQREYIAAIRSHDLTFGIGPAGTGKTYLAMAMAAAALMKKQVKRIILTRPAVEAGERLGFLPGDLAEKVNPYLRPLYDALHDMLDYERIQQLRSRGQIEVAPLAFMRGRTLNESFVILDEAQNATTDQMKMFLTRLGYASKAVVTGDVTQSDLPRGARSGLREAWELLHEVDGIAFCEFADGDVVRHPLVQKIVVAYDRHEAAQRRIREARRREAAGESSETPAERAPDAPPPASTPPDETPPDADRP